MFRKENNQTYYLLLHYQSGHWEFVKGHIELGERDEQTVRRELEEETGIKDARIIPGFKERTKYFFRQYQEKVSEEDRRKGLTPWVFKMVFFFIVETNIKDIRLSDEHIGYKWLPYEQAIKQLTHKNAKNLLKKAKEFLDKNNL